MSAPGGIPPPPPPPPGMAQGNIPIVPPPPSASDYEDAMGFPLPPPPESLRYSQQYSTNRTSIISQSNNSSSRNSYGLPPPQSIRNSQFDVDRTSRTSLDRDSYFPPPPPEAFPLERQESTSNYYAHLDHYQQESGIHGGEDYDSIAGSDSRSAGSNRRISMVLKAASEATDYAGSTSDLSHSSFNRNTLHARRISQLSRGDSYSNSSLSRGELLFLENII